MRLANKISLSFFIMVLITTFIIAPLIYFYGKDKLEKLILSKLDATIASRASHLETFLEDHEKMTTQIAASYLIVRILDKNTDDIIDFNVLKKRAKLELRRYLALQKEFSEISILGLDGRILISTNDQLENADRSTDAYFLGGLKGPFIKDFHYSEKKNMPVLTMSSSVMNKEGSRVTGILAASLTADKLYEITTDRTDLGETGEIYIINKYGYMVTPSRFLENTFLRTKVETVNAANCLAQKDTGDEVERTDDPIIFKDYRGVAVLGTSRFITKMNWGLLGEIDQKEAMMPIYLLGRLFLIILFMIPILSWFVGTIVANIITGPLQKLRQGALRVGKGDLNYRIGIRTNDEIGQLSQEFDKKVHDLQSKTTSIAALNKEIFERQEAEKELHQNEIVLQQLLRDMEEANNKLKNTQTQLVQSEKLASIGQLAAGIAHEINNPVGFVSSNLATLGTYLRDITTVLRENEPLRVAVKKKILMKP